MMSADIVVELDRWRTTPRTTQNAHEFVPISRLLKAARDEIVALRSMPRPCTCHPDERPHPCQLRYAFSECMAAYNQVRDEALEEAARLVERYCDSPVVVEVAGVAAAKAIRALKDKNASPGN